MPLQPVGPHGVEGDDGVTFDAQLPPLRGEVSDVKGQHPPAFARLSLAPAPNGRVQRRRSLDAAELRRHI